MASAWALALAMVAAVSAQTVPANSVTLDTRACQPPHDTFPFCDTRLSLDERVNDLIARVWATSKDVIPELLTARNMGRSNLSALGVPEYDYGLNAIHGVQSSCVSDANGVHCPTSFPNPVNYGSAWNKSLVHELGFTIAIESRALWLAGAVEQSPRNHIGLDTWSPNINVARDPRWGRSCEVASEDPLINGDFGSQYTQGLQMPGLDDGHIAMISTLKHWDAYSFENSTATGARRYDFNAVVSPYALATTYFPAFEQSVVEGGALGVMCSYNAVNGVPTCASPMLTHVLRDVWNFRGYVTSDSGALENIAGNHHYTNSSLASVPVALRDGQTDVCSGGIYSSFLLPALDAGLITREDIDLALSHTFRMRFQMGLFDPPASTPYWSLPLSSVGTPAAQAANLLATQESMVLLKHDGVTLPLPVGKNIAVIGPHANATAASLGNYLGQICADNTFSCVVSPFLALRELNEGGSVKLAFGCPITKNDTSLFAAAVALCSDSDVCVLVLGIDGSVENEMRDRESIDLPAVQHALAAAVTAVGKPTVLVLIHGGSVDVTAERDNSAIGAILDAGYPGFLGGTVIAQTLFGMNDHLGGKLAMTCYESSFVTASNMSDMEVDTGVGRGYRYYTGTPVFAFGHGLSLTSFTLTLTSGPSAGTLVTEAAPTTSLTYVVTVTNTGSRTGCEVVQAYFSPRETPSQPLSKLIKQLFDYRRVHLAPGASQQVSFTVNSATLRMVDRTLGDTVSTPGSFDILFTNGVDQTLRLPVSVSGVEIVVRAFPGDASNVVSSSLSLPPVSASPPPPPVLLRNAAVPGTLMPWVGCGSGGYTGNATQPYGSYPECFNGCADAECAVPNPLNFSSCGEYVEASISTFLQLGGARIDSSASYHNQVFAGIATRASRPTAAARAATFFVSKVGPYLALGGAEALAQFKTTLQTTGLSYIDLLLIHWPDCMSGGGTAACEQYPSTEPTCAWKSATYDASACRLATWRALVSILGPGVGQARAIGVSNFNASHLQEIKDAGLPLPSVNQIPIFPYRWASQAETIAWCAANNVVVNGYSPFGVPDRRTYLPPLAVTPLVDPVILGIAAAHGTSAANVILAWHYAHGIVMNPRSQNAAHMIENIGGGALPWWDLAAQLTPAELTALDTRPQA